VAIISHMETTPLIVIPPEPRQNVIDGLIKNAVENTPDEGTIEVGVLKRGKGSLLHVHDYRVRIPDEARRRIFEAFFTTRDAMTYSTKTPFDFNAGGRGANLCPSRISQCKHCSTTEGCRRSGKPFLLFTSLIPPKQNGTEAFGYWIYRP
jgi:light-regulated signal transduction histidine kinase (bacteriophytochrome)